MERSLDFQGRWRHRIVSFRASEEEVQLLNDCVKLSGLTKQDYIIRRVLHREVLVQGNTRVHKALREKMAEMLEELKRIEKGSEINEEFFYTLQLVAEIFNGLKEENNGIK